MFRLCYPQRNTFASITSINAPRLLGRYHSQHPPPLPTPPHISALITPEDTQAARSWISTFKTQIIPRGAVELTFSRSSGPGGQHVNKVNTKTTLRCPLDSPWIPVWAHQDLKANPHYVASSNSILITSSVYRSQVENIEDCLKKLHDLILSTSSASIKTEPSEEQKKRVEALERAEKAWRRQEKSYRSEVKKGRAKGEWD
ncbi:Peptidyl-tRNA hydrolase ICT1, mitochondrial [Hypsizygus marmoreus]|uniref:Peptidyl-tRNA hydrolase ICT1, mitochondrial n=1 Tax=Hypsizygus marmoreus TaxID=39966 RepID=A0A369K066_HYPMA|nr:Peptidyl-tRNA hydrolase ICT1, mitochondrial [Hypsizygus marmoreus]